MKLSDAIKQGMVGREQLTHTFLNYSSIENRVDACCALGAAILAVNERIALKLARDFGFGEAEDEVEYLFPQLRDLLEVKTLTPKAVKDWFALEGRSVSIDRTGRIELLQIVYAMNDGLGWTSKRIANWLKRRGY